MGFGIGSVTGALLGGFIYTKYENIYFYIVSFFALLTMFVFILKSKKINLI